MLARLAETGESVKETLFRLCVLGIEDGEPKLNWRGIATLARHIEIEDHGKPINVLWDPYDEQLKAWEALCDNLWVYFLKSRQVGLTMCVLLFDAIWTGVRDALGSSVSTALLWHRMQKAEEQILRIDKMVFQLGLPLRQKTTQRLIRFPNGSRVEARSANSRGATRGLSYQRFHCSEIPFWGRATQIWGAMLPSLNLSAPVTFETTMDSAQDPLAAEQWQKDNEFHKVFFPFEMHRGYKADPDLIPDEQWEWLKTDEGFTDRASAAWWWKRCQDKMNGDRTVAFREYPQLVRHAFTAAEGRYIRMEPAILTPVEIWPFYSEDGNRRYEVEVYRPPERTSGQLIQAIDTAGGNGGDRSVMLMIDKVDRAIVCAVWSEWMSTDELADISNEVAVKYQPHINYLRRTRGQRWLPATVATVVETNGPLGSSTYDALERLGSSPVSYGTGRSKSGTREQTLSEARRWVEAGACFGPELLAEEARRLSRGKRPDGKDGGWYGHDDCLMALGIGLRHLLSHPAAEDPAPAGKTEEQRWLEEAEADYDRGDGRRGL